VPFASKPINSESLWDTGANLTAAPRSAYLPAADGYRLIVRKEGRRIRLFTRRGFDWSGRYSRITIALEMLRARSATIDGEAVYCRKDGLSDFEKLHSHAYNEDVFLYALLSSMATTFGKSLWSDATAGPPEIGRIATTLATKTPTVFSRNV
jgi:bifunctional non-homologous end joining protein LigD